MKSSGASQIFVKEISEARRKQAEKLGATLTIDPTTENAVEIIKANTNGGVNVSFEAAVVQPTFDGALASVKPRGEVLIIAYGKNQSRIYQPFNFLKKNELIHPYVMPMTFSESD